MYTFLFGNQKSETFYALHVWCTTRPNYTLKKTEKKEKKRKKFT